MSKHFFKRRRPSVIKGYKESFLDWATNNRWELESFLTLETGKHKNWIVEYSSGAVGKYAFLKPLTKRQCINSLHSTRSPTEARVIQVIPSALN